MSRNIADMIRSCMDVYCEKLYGKYGDSCEKHCVFCNEGDDCYIRAADDFIKKAWEKGQEGEIMINKERRDKNE